METEGGNFIRKRRGRWGSTLSCTAALVAIVSGLTACTRPASPIAQPRAASSVTTPWLPFADLSYEVQPDGLPAGETVVSILGDIGPGPEEKQLRHSVAGLRPNFAYDGISLNPKNSADYQQSFDAGTGRLETRWRQEKVGHVSISLEGRGSEVRLVVSVSPEHPGELIGEITPKVELGRTTATQGFAPDDAATKTVASVEKEPVSLTLVTRLYRDTAGGLPDKPPLIILDGPDSDQRAIQSLAFQVAGYVGNSGPFGLTNDRYYGHVFWDADAWIFPSLALLSPEQASKISAYRIRTQKGASENYDSWLDAGRPIGGDESMPGSEYMPNGTALKYAWESAQTGRETAPGNSQFQEHIGGTVVRSLEVSAALGLSDSAAVKAVGEGVARYYLSRIEAGEAGFNMRGVMSPDEYHMGQNDLYTNLVAEHVIEKYAPASHVDLNLPRDLDGNFLTYEGDKLRSYQQAAALLAIFPLQNAEAESEAIFMLDRFSPKVAANGPAMSHSLHALIRARFGDADKAYSEWREAYDRYAKPPFGYISERPTTTQTVFVTGAAGFLNTLLYGFLGIRIDEQPWGDADWKMPLKNGWWISGRANLPRTWNSLLIPDLKILGSSYSLEATREGSILVKNTPKS